MSHDVTLAAEPHAPAEVIHVAYQEFSVDWAVADGTYTPQQLKKSKVVVKPGPERRYSLCWPGGAPQPAALDGGR